MEIKEMAIEELSPYENNPRRNDNAVDAVANSIKEFGFKVPIVVDADKVIVAGHTRYKAAQKLGLEKVPCVIASDLTAEQIRAFRLVDNKTAELSLWDFEKLDEELKSLSTDIIQEFNFELPKQGDEGSETTLNRTTDLRPIRNFETITFLVTTEQNEEIKKALHEVESDIRENFGNMNKAGNGLYEIVKQWHEKRGLTNGSSS